MITNFLRWLALIWSTFLLQVGLTKAHPIKVTRVVPEDPRVLRLRLDVLRAVHRGALTVPAVVGEVRTLWPDCYTAKIAQVTWELLDQGVLKRDEESHLEVVL